ncbi:hypothetical protein GGF32_001871 [Allomyces javanicus]|nr:hypothetical protein GGF32_001871 [Allomyces javanicus]
MGGADDGLAARVVSLSMSASTEASAAAGITDYRIWTFFVYCLVVVIVFLFFSFYFNRVLAYLLSRVVSYWTWRKYKAHIEVESIKLAILGGRISFRNLRYHGENQTIAILQGHITFRYWKFHIIDEADVAKNQRAPPGKSTDGAEGHGGGQVPWMDQSGKMCRIGIRVKGIEWIMYNRLPAFDYIEEQLKRSQAPGRPISAVSTESVNMMSSSQDPLNEPTTGRPAATSDDSWFRRILPVEIQCGKGSIILGNPELPTIVVVDWKRAVGSYAVVPSRSSLDPYKTVLNVAFYKGQMQMRMNVDYNPPFVSTQVNTFQSQSHLNRLARPPIFKQLRERVAHWFARSAARVPPPEWHGLNRYQINQDEQGLGEAKEYARHDKIVEFSSLTLSYYVDTAGVCPESEPTRNLSPDAVDIGNGDLDPEWGVDLVFYSATIHYGPWADRQRAFLQSFFFPYAHRDNTPTDRLAPGDLRVHPALKFQIRFEGETLWRVPTREPSKDTTFAATEDEAMGGTTTRPYGWLDIRVAGASATVNVPMVIGPNGYTTTVQAELESVAATSSVNYAELLLAPALNVSVAMPAPLQWNASRTWDIGITAASPTLFLLRDHITLFQDLIADWGTVDTRMPLPASPLALFVPITYQIKLAFKSVELQLCINEFNVIDVPNDLDENNFFTISTDALDAAVTLSFLEYLPTFSIVEFNVGLMGALGRFSFAKCSTFGQFLPSEALDAISSNHISIGGSYLYHAVEATEESPDVLELDVLVNGGTITATGFLVRYLIILIDNYVGLYPSFMTLEEYKTEGRHLQDDPTIPSSPQDTMITAILKDIRLVLPESLFGAGPHTSVRAEEATIDTRITPHYQDLQFDSWPMVWQGRAEQDHITVASVSVHGHRLFGLPPLNPEYAVSWRAKLGPISGAVDVSSVHGLVRCADAFIAHFKDLDNMIRPPDPKPSSFAQISLEVPTIDLEVLGQGGHFIKVVLDQVYVGNEDLGQDDTTLVSLATVKIAHVLTTGDDSVELAHFLAQHLFLHMRTRPDQHSPSYQERILHVLRHDAPTGRLSNLFGVVPDVESVWYAPPMVAAFGTATGTAPGMPFSYSNYNLSGQAVPPHEPGFDDSVPVEVAGGSDQELVGAATFNDRETPPRHAALSPIEDVEPDEALTPWPPSPPEISSSTSIHSFATALDAEARLRSSTHDSSQLAFPIQRFGTPILAANPIPCRNYLNTFHRDYGEPDPPLPSAQRDSPLLNLLVSLLSGGSTTVFLDFKDTVSLQVCPTSLEGVPAFLGRTQTVDSLFDELYLAYLAAASQFAAATSTIPREPNHLTVGCAIRDLTCTLLQETNAQQVLQTTATLSTFQGALGPEWVQLKLSNLSVHSIVLPPIPAAGATPKEGEPVLSLDISNAICDGGDRVRFDWASLDVQVVNPDVVMEAATKWQPPDLPAPKGVESLLSLLTLIPAAPVEPVFLTQPSNMWRLGARPHQQSSTWRFLCLIRNHLSNPDALRDADAILARQDLPPITAVGLPSLQSSWRVSDHQGPMAFDFVWNKPATKHRALWSKDGVFLSAKLDASTLTIEDNVLRITGISLVAHGLDQIFINVEDVHALAKPSIITLVQSLIEAQSKAANTIPEPKVASLSRPSAMTPKQERHLVMSIGTIEVVGLTHQVRATVELTGTTVSLLDSPVIASGLGTVPSSMSSGRKEDHTSIGWSVDTVDVRMIAANPLLEMSLHQLSGVSAKKHLVQVHSIQFELPQNILQLYAFFEEWKSQLPVPRPASPTPSPTTSTSKTKAASLLSFSSTPLALDVAVANVRLSLGILPSLSVHSELSVLISLNDGWSVDISRFAIGFTPVGKEVTMIPLPTLRLAMAKNKTTVIVGVLEGVIRSSTVQPIETSLWLLSREINDVLELLVFLSPRLNFSSRNPSPTSKTGPAAASAHPSSSTATAGQVDVLLEGIALLLLTEKGSLRIESNQVTGAKFGDGWSFDSSHMALAFLSPSNAVLSQIQLAGSATSSTILSVVVRRLNMLVQPRAVQQMLEVAAFIMAEAKARRAAKEQEIQRLGATTQRVIESLDMQWDAASPAAPMTRWEIAVSSVSCLLMLDAQHSAEVSLRSLHLVRDHQAYQAVLHDILYMLGDSRLLFPQWAVNIGADVWSVQVAPYQITIQDQLALSITKLVDEVRNFFVSAQRVVEAYNSGTKSTKADAPAGTDSAAPTPRPGHAELEPATAVKFPNLDVQIESGKGLVIDSNVQLPAVRALHNGDLLWIYVAATKTVLHPSLVGLIHSLLASPFLALAERDHDPVYETTSAASASPPAAAAAAPPLPFQVLVVLDPTEIDLKGKRSKCLGRFRTSGTAHFHQNKWTVHVPLLSFSVHHPFAVEDCTHLLVTDALFTRDAEGIKGDVPSVQLSLVLRHTMELLGWVDEWTESVRPAPNGAVASSLASVRRSPSIRPSAAAAQAPEFPLSVVVVRSFEVSVNMGQSIGKAVAASKDLFFHAEKQTVHAVGDLHLALTGRVQGDAKLDHLHATAHLLPDRTVIHAGFDLFQVRLKYQTDVVLVLELDTLGVLVVMQPANANVDMRMSGITVLTSSRTAPSVLNIVHRLKDVIGVRPIRGSNGTDAGGIKTGELSANASNGSLARPVPEELDTRKSGSFTILLGSLGLHVFSDSLEDQEHITALLEKLVIHLTVAPGDPTDRVLKAHLNSAKLQQTVPSSKPNTGDASKTASATAAPTAHLLQLARTQRIAKLIASVPAADLTMNTSASSADRTVRHTFVTAFDGMVDLALNMILYRNLTDMITLYDSEVTRTMRTLQIAKTAVVSAADEAADEAATKWVLVPVEPPVLAPRLKMMGEATPPLDWLVKKDVVPELVHTYLTMSLDQAIRALAKDT